LTNVNERMVGMSKQKYKRGRAIRSIEDFEYCPSEFYIVKFGKTEKTTHYSFLISWQYRTLRNFIELRRVFVAERIGETT